MVQPDPDSAPPSPQNTGSVEGVMAGGGTVPLRLPAGALNYLDRDQYISNMEVLAYYPSIKLKMFGDEHSVCGPKASAA